MMEYNFASVVNLNLCLLPDGLTRLQEYLGFSSDYMKGGTETN